MRAVGPEIFSPVIFSTASAMAWMKECKQKNAPFLCYLPTNAPHAPHIDLDEYIKPYQARGPAASPLRSAATAATRRGAP